jgi:hypothetical protein
MKGEIVAVSRKGGPQQRIMSDQERDLGQGIAMLGGAGNLIQGVVKLLGWELEFPTVAVAKALPIENASLVKAWLRLFAINNPQTEAVDQALDYGARKSVQMLSAGELILDLDSFKTVLESVDVLNAAIAADKIAETYVSANSLSHDDAAKAHCAIYGVFVSFLFSKNKEGYFTLGRKAQSNGDFKQGFEVLFCASAEAIINELTNFEGETSMSTATTTANANATTTPAQAAPAVAPAPAPVAPRVTQATAQAAADALQQAAFEAAVADAVAKAMAAQQAAALAAAQAAAPAPQAAPTPVPPVAAPQAPAAPLAAPASVPTPAPTITMADILKKSKEAQAAHEQLRAEVTAANAATSARLTAVEQKQSGFEARLAALEAAKKTSTETTKVVVSGSSSTSSECWVDPTLFF